ncbi:helix-turn-helix domain-containing protein [Sphingomonas sp. DC2300-3]|uniref:helix-turn-helix domain-containing protein n=1 Tax=unclassified Sphingomonas TaxID=196159 RepID=UPI003CEAD24D
MTHYALGNILRVMDAIKQTRKKLGATQAELAEMLGINQSTVSRLERGALPIDPRTALALEALSARARVAEQAPV